MNKNLYACIAFAFFTLSFLPTLSAQTLEEAKALFKEGKFEEAKPIFEQYIQKAPTNASYNHWYGVCCYETGEKEKCAKYLKFASTRKVQEAYRYLGNYYYETYDFENAIKQFESYIKINKDTAVKAEYQDRIDQTNQALKMVNRVADIQIIDSLVVDKKNLYSQLKQKTLENNIHPVSDIFETSSRYTDTYLFINQRETQRIYPFDSDSSGFNLVIQDKLSDRWGERKMLPKEVNSREDENYPFIMADGITIYFSSKGHNSIGGYDIFVTRYDAEEGKYFPAENIGMPFNSPGNDYFYAIDENNNIGWFATDRSQPEGQVILYTFIPNENQEVIRNKEPEEMKDFARISSIRNTWKKEEYASLLADIYKSKSSMHEEFLKKQSEEFRFYIDENTVYTRISDFKSLDAKNYFIQYQNKQKEVEEIEQRLENWRNMYAKENKHKKEELKKTILDLEKKYETVVHQPRLLANKSRIAEIEKMK